MDKNMALAKYRLTDTENCVYIYSGTKFTLQAQPLTFNPNTGTLTISTNVDTNKESFTNFNDRIEKQISHRKKDIQVLEKERVE